MLTHYVPRILAGTAPAVYTALETNLLEVICGKNDTCARCTQLRDKTYYGLVWLTPSKNSYTLADLEKIFQTVTFAHSATEKWCVVIDHADRLTTVCANQLLKVLEEPPPAVAFFLVCRSAQDLLPTIVSRCVVENVTHGNNEKSTEFVRALQRAAELSLTDFHLLWQQHGPEDHQARELLDALIIHYRDRRDVVQFLASYYEKLPMPGSSKFFWRSIFLGIKIIF